MDTMNYRLRLLNKDGNMVFMADSFDKHWLFAIAKDHQDYKPMFFTWSVERTLEGVKVGWIQIEPPAL